MIRRLRPDDGKTFPYAFYFRVADKH